MTDFASKWDLLFESPFATICTFCIKISALKLRLKKYNILGSNLEGSAAVGMPFMHLLQRMTGERVHSRLALPGGCGES